MKYTYVMIRTFVGDRVVAFGKQNFTSLMIWCQTEHEFFMTIEKISFLPVKHYEICVQKYLKGTKSLVSTGKLNKTQ